MLGGLLCVATIAAMLLRHAMPDHKRVGAESPMMDPFPGDQVVAERIPGIREPLAEQPIRHNPEVISPSEAGRIPHETTATRHKRLPLIHIKKRVRKRRPGPDRQALFARHPQPIVSHARATSLWSGVITFAG